MIIKSIQAKIALGVASALVVGLMGAAAFAQTATLGVACAGVASTNTITWTATATNGTAPYHYAWGGTASGTSSVAAVTYSATGTYQATVAVTDSASGTAATATTTCSAVVASLPGSTTPPPPPPPAPAPTPHFQQPMLNINPSGRFMARGMIVTSVGTNSFQGTVWGITYTVNVNVTNNIQGDEPEFFLRGKGGGHFDLAQLKVGDELGVQGTIDASAPLVVTAQVVRDYSLAQLRPKHKESDDNNQGNQGDHRENGSSSDEMRSKLQGLLQRFKELQFRVGGHGGQGGDN